MIDDIMLDVLMLLRCCTIDRMMLLNNRLSSLIRRNRKSLPKRPIAVTNRCGTFDIRPNQYRLQYIPYNDLDIFLPNTVILDVTVDGQRAYDFDTNAAAGNILQFSIISSSYSCSISEDCPIR